MMTNEEKFIEVFGVKPESYSQVLECPPYHLQCRYYSKTNGWCNCEKWWKEEFVNKESDGNEKS